MNTNNRVWIELELPPAGAPQTGHDRAAAASKMLTKLGVDMGGYDPVWFDEKKWRYAFTESSAGCFTWATDHGHWFNLDYLAE
jgi:hypothetical protein